MPVCSGAVGAACAAARGGRGHAPAGNAGGFDDFGGGVVAPPHEEDPVRPVLHHTDDIGETAVREPYSYRDTFSDVLRDDPVDVAPRQVHERHPDCATRVFRPHTRITTSVPITYRTRNRTRCRMSRRKRCPEGPASPVGMRGRDK